MRSDLVVIQQTQITEAEIINRWDLATGREERAEKTLAESRLEKGRILVEARKMFPALGRLSGGWSKLLARLRVEETTARNYMRLAGYVDEENSANVADFSERPPTYAEAGIIKSKPKRVEIEDLSDESDIEEEITPKHYRSAFLLRADQAVRFASYSGPVSKEVVDWAKRAADAWSKLARQMENKL